MSSFASRRFCGIFHPRCTERLRTLSNVQSDAFTGLIYASRRDQISGMRTVHVHAIGIESPGRCHIVIAKPGYSWVAKIAEDVVTDPMVFCTTVYIVIYILLLLQSFVASSVQFVNEGNLLQVPASSWPPCRRRGHTTDTSCAAVAAATRAA